MLKKTITYDNLFTEEKVTEEHYFHISKADLVEMEMEEHKDEYTDKAGKKLTGMQAKLQRIVDSEDGKAIMAEFKDMIRRSYGKKDGDRFVKSPELWAEFSSSEAYSQLLFELCTDAGAAAEFINGVVPSNLELVAEDLREKSGIGSSSDAMDALSKAANGLGTGDPTAPRVLSQAEVAEMDSDELKSGLATGRYKLS